ncbi:MAG: DUF2064 domain-containing protein [Eggerthellales bacterium]|nr:DUF2064 domain-containing protein [Eggerthellales bacterium]
MTVQKEALLLFSKPPIPGKVKTRLTTKFGGFMSDNQAADFFKMCLYDVAETCIHALFELQWANDAAVAENPEATKIQYDFFVGCPEANLQLMKDTFDEIGPWPMEIHYITDSGATFDDHFDDAFSQIFGMGYDCIVSVGGDIPTLPKDHLTQSFTWLEYFRNCGTPGVVMAPCQECGTSLVGFHYDTPINHQGVYYNMEGKPALDAYIEKIDANHLPCAYFAPIADIDEVTDLAHAISCLKAMKRAAEFQPTIRVAQRVLNWVDYMGITVSTPPNEEHDPRQYLDNPDGTHYYPDEENK